jgi:hypothetical protein
MAAIPSDLAFRYFLNSNSSVVKLRLSWAFSSSRSIIWSMALLSFLSLKSLRLQIFSALVVL